MSETIPATMRAMQLAAPAPAVEAPLKLVQLPVPEPGPGQVLLRVLACGVCRTDLHILEGELLPHRSPVVPGHQIVGEVVALAALSALLPFLLPLAAAMVAGYMIAGEAELGTLASSSCAPSGGARSS